MLWLHAAETSDSCDRDTIYPYYKTLYDQYDSKAVISRENRHIMLL